MDNQSITRLLQDIYRRLMDAYGPQYWWPAEEPFEVMVGAILTQSTSWRNVEKAISNLKTASALSPKVLRRFDTQVIAELIRPCGYYNAKARKLKALVRWLGEYYDNDTTKLSEVGMDRLREQLLSVYGIGPETADSIILYAANKPVFIIDAYTRRIIDRIGIGVDSNSYTAYQSLFQENLPAETGLFNEYHALLVCLGKNVCRRRPLCEKCCLGSICHFGIYASHT